MSLIATLRPTTGSFASLFAYIVTTCVGQRIGNSPGAKVLNPSPNFVVSSLIMIKFGVLIEFDKVSSKIAKKVSKMTSLKSYDIMFCLRLAYPSKFRISLFLDGFG